jgi:hypothetical protein
VILAIALFPMFWNSPRTCIIFINIVVVEVVWELIVMKDVKNKKIPKRRIFASMQVNKIN